MAKRRQARDVSDDSQLWSLLNLLDDQNNVLVFGPPGMKKFLPVVSNGIAVALALAVHFRIVVEPA